MQKISTTLCLIMISSLLFAQGLNDEPPISFEQFREQVKNLRVPGFSGGPQMEQEEGEYTAAFVQGEEIFMIQLGHRMHPPEWSNSPYKFEGKDAEYVNIGWMNILAIDLPGIQAFLTLGSTKEVNQSDLEAIARQTGIMDLEIAQTTIPWPSRIPLAYRLQGELIKANEHDGKSEGFSYIITVNLIFSQELRASLGEMIKDYGNEGGFLVLPNGMILNFPFEELEGLDNRYSFNDRIAFSYYIP